MELLIVIGIFGILAAVVISAINPQKQLCEVQNSKRDSNARELKNALVQYLIDNGSYPQTIPTGSSNAAEICAYNASDTSGCLDMDALVASDYLVTLESDIDETDANLLGYQVYKDGPLITVVATNRCVSTGYGG